MHTITDWQNEHGQYQLAENNFMHSLMRRHVTVVNGKRVFSEWYDWSWDLEGV